MTIRDDAKALRNQWTDDFLKKYNGKWIAFQNGEVQNSNVNFLELSAAFEPSYEENEGPIFAYVTISALA